MYFLNVRILWLIGNCVRLTSIFHVSPFVWNRSEKKVEYNSSKSARSFSIFVRILYLLHQVFLSARLLHSLGWREIDFGSLVLQMTCYLMFLIACGIQASFTFIFKEWIVFLNHYHQFFRSVEACRASATSAFFVLNVVVVLPVALSALMVQYSSLPHFITSLLENPNDILTLCIATPIYYLIFLATCTSYTPIFMFIIPFISDSTELIRQLKPTDIYKKTTLKPPIRAYEVFRIYRSLQILFNDFNYAIINFLILLNYVIIVGAVLCMYLLIRFGRNIELVTTVNALASLFGSTAFLLLVYKSFGEICESSALLLSSWARYKECKSKDDWKLMLCHVRSIPQLKVRLAAFGFYKKSNTLPRLNKLIYYTAKFLVMTKSFN